MRQRRLRLALLAWCLAWSGREAGAQTAPFVDDAGRRVLLPTAVTRVFAGGAPAEVLLHTLAPELLGGRNRLPEGEAATFFPEAYRRPLLIRRLPDRDDPSGDAEMQALAPQVYIDYGTIDADYVASVDAIQRRTGVPGIILNGALERIPGVYRALGSVLGLASRGELLAELSERLLGRYRGVLARGAMTPRVYLACSGDGSVPCLADTSAGEQLAWLGAINVAGTRETAARGPISAEAVAAMRPDVILVPGGPPAVVRLRNDPRWQVIDAVAKGRVYSPPEVPYSWGVRPPSVNRLPGLAWMSSVLGGPLSDAEVRDDIGRFFRVFYQVALTEGQQQAFLKR